MSVQLIMISGASLLKKVKLLPLYDPCSYKMGQVIKKVDLKERYDMCATLVGISTHRLWRCAFCIRCQCSFSKFN